MEDVPILVQCVPLNLWGGSSVLISSVNSAKTFLGMWDVLCAPLGCLGLGCWESPMTRSDSVPSNTSDVWWQSCPVLPDEA